MISRKRDVILYYNMADITRDRRGRFRKIVIKEVKKDKSIIIEHNYCLGTLCNNSSCENSKCITCNNDVPAHINKDSWKVGRDIIELLCLLVFKKLLLVRISMALFPPGRREWNGVPSPSPSPGQILHVHLRDSSR